MDKSLEEIIANRPGLRRRRARGPRVEILGRDGPSPATRARVKAGTTPPKDAAGPPAQVADKIIVSNLPQDVNEAQIKELFHTTVGPLREVTLHYDAAGRSKGIATVQFHKKGDGTKAFQQYNNRLIDGKRPMKIEMVFGPQAPASLVTRVAPPPAQVTENPAARPKGRRGGGGRRPKNERPQKSAADLDAEMEDYTASNAPAA